MHARLKLTASGRVVYSQLCLRLQLGRGQHPIKDVRKALAAVSAHLTVAEIHRGHGSGVLTCTVCGAEFDIYTTPKDPGTAAKLIRRFADKHQHTEP